MYHYTDGGLRNVWLANGYEIKKTPYGEGVAFHNVDGLTRSICIALTRKASLLTGAEFRYIRSAGMLLSQPALGKLMGIDGQSVARWEKTSKVPRWADKLVRLLYTAHAEGNEPIADDRQNRRACTRRLGDHTARPCAARRSPGDHR